MTEGGRRQPTSWLPVLVRPSYVLGGQGMEIAYKEADVREFMQVITRNKVENRFWSIST